MYKQAHQLAPFYPQRVDEESTKALTTQTMANKWFKFWGQDWMTDPKVIKLDPIHRLCFLTLLCQASASDVQGTIKDLDEETLLLMTHLPIETQRNATGVLEALSRNGMITNDNGVITIKNFAKRQEISLTPYERVKRYRQKKQNDNPRIEENRIDKNRNTTKISFDKFWDVYPNKVNKKRAEQKWNHLSESTQKLILEDVAKRKESPPWKRDGGAYIPHPTTYLNGERWLDELPANVPNMSSLKLGKAKTHDSHN